MSSNVYLMLLLLFVFSCVSEQKVWYGEVKEFAVPCKQGGESNLFLSEFGDIYLSWLEYEDDTLVSLRFSKWLGEKWSESTEIANGADWFVNWADFPAMAAGGKDGQHLVAHHLKKSSPGTYDYNVMISQSFDKGLTWGSPKVLHKDSINAEHGFVSILSKGDEGIALSWLDGRNTKTAADQTDKEAHHHGGSMSLRYTELSPEGHIRNSVALDDRVCDCCQTDMAMSKDGPVVVYSDRSEGEIRDIYLCKQRNGIWLEPKVVYQDNWEIAGCPVNGPAVDAKGDQLVVFWYTMVGEEPGLRYALSSDGGDSFFNVSSLDSRERVMGRVDVRMLDGNRAILIWMEQGENNVSFIRAKMIDFSGREYEAITLVETEASRASGFPRIVIKDGRLFLTWTALQDADERIKSLIMDLG